MLRDITYRRSDEANKTLFLILNKELLTAKNAQKISDISRKVSSFLWEPF